MGGSSIDMDCLDEIREQTDLDTQAQCDRDVRMDAEIALLRDQGRPVPEHLLEWERSQTNSSDAPDDIPF